MKTKILILLCVLTIGMGNLTVCRAEDKMGETIADVALVRPGCFVATLLGSAVFVLALPFAAISHSVHQTADTLVLTPARATFTRPLGDFSTIQ